MVGWGRDRVDVKIRGSEAGRSVLIFNFKKHLF